MIISLLHRDSIIIPLKEDLRIKMLLNYYVKMNSLTPFLVKIIIPLEIT